MHKIDNDRKVVTLHRTNFKDSDHYIIINMGDNFALDSGSYSIPVETDGFYRVELDSSSTEFGGTGELQDSLNSQKVLRSENSQLTIPRLDPYAVIVIKRLK
jgi:hypothetical protein